MIFPKYHLRPFLPVFRKKEYKPNYPPLERYSVRQFDFFFEKHKNQNKRQIYKPDDLDALAMDIFWIAQCMFHTTELVDFHEKLRQIIKSDMDSRESVKSAHLPIVRHLSFIDKLSDFYEFHLDRGGSVKDRRVEYLVALRMKVKLAIKFMKKRSKEIHGT